eukprot:CAMPEP_0198439110 /NCGR_PEP_ID=MMETSP1452-20131203/53721_1 /TAXON_ID=1181717 /ORGANISM="Synchroma pusillum, Strain CCMP3072" /LENGTH=252 /DNA_ID=CAMNT_0044159711 /DNA_START=33 /DNA_END=788 /DNA_ORIENTATION=-
MESAAPRGGVRRNHERVHGGKDVGGELNGRAVGEHAEPQLGPGALRGAALERFARLLHGPCDVPQPTAVPNRRRELAQGPRVSAARPLVHREGVAAEIQTHEVPVAAQRRRDAAERGAVNVAVGHAQAPERGGFTDELGQLLHALATPSGRQLVGVELEHAQRRVARRSGEHGPAALLHASPARPGVAVRHVHHSEARTACHHLAQEARGVEPGSGGAVAHPRVAAHVEHLERGLAAQASAKLRHLGGHDAR